MSERTGILGGVFDPVHNGHCAIASLARDYLKLDKVLFIPSGVPPHKSSVVASAKHRIAMLELALENTPWAQIWDHEIYRSGYSYTFDTIKSLQKSIDGPIHFIIGSDNVKEIPTWYRYKELLSLITLCVVYRPGYPDTITEELRDATIVTIPSPQWGISSTMVRDYLGKGYSCKFCIPDKVIEYIKTNDLYRISETVV